MSIETLVESGFRLDALLSILGERPEVLFAETYSYEIPGHAPMLWNVSQAIIECENGHVDAVVPIAHAEMAGIVNQCGWDEAHLARADPERPGIAAPIRLDGVVFFILIDGTHRCVRAYREQRPFLARCLSLEAAQRCVLLAPSELLAW